VRAIRIYLDLAMKMFRFIVMSSLARLSHTRKIAHWLLHKTTTTMHTVHWWWCSIIFHLIGNCEYVSCCYFRCPLMVRNNVKIAQMPGAQVRYFVVIVVVVVVVVVVMLMLSS
jgi:hypothetical protein